MALPQFLVIEMRAAFRACAQQHRYTNIRAFSTHPASRKQAPSSPKSSSIPQKGKAVSRPPQIPQAGILVSTNQPQNTTSTLPSSPSPLSQETQIVPQEKDKRSLDTGRRVPVPYKVIPKPQLTPNLTLSPRERLHIEVLTRRLPPPSEKKVYRTRMQIYHMGTSREIALSFLRVLCIVGLSATTFVIGPAHLAAGSSSLLVLSIFLGGFVPLAAVHYFTKSTVTKVFLNLPPTARETPRKAMEYARNLPGNAELDIWFKRPWALESKITARLEHLEPRSGTKWKPLTFAWLKRYADPGNWLAKNPSEFFVSPESAGGTAARDTIPGLWEEVYRRLTGRESVTVERWRR